MHCVATDCYSQRLLMGYFPNFSKYNLNSVPTPTSVSKSISKTK